MKHKITIVAYLDLTDAATRDQIKDYILPLRAKMQRVNYIETSTILIEECHHDEDPPKPCVPLYSWQKT